LSDVYSLGMLLCELLVGRLPFSFETRMPGEVAAVVTTHDPLTPSSLAEGEARRRLRGDLDTIVLTALARNRSERYSSVERLADDVRAHLEGRPIAVRREPIYRARKFIRRNRLAVGATTLVAGTLVAGIAATAWEARRADAQSEAARAVTAFLQDDLLTQASTRAQAGGSTIADPNLTVRTALDRAAARIEGKFVSQPRIEAGIRRTIGQTYLSLGLYPDAQKHLERAVALFRALDGAAGSETLEAMHSLGYVLHMEGKNAPAEAMLTSVLEEQQRRFGADSAPVNGTLNDLATTISSMGRRHEADVLRARVLDISRRLYGEDHPETLAATNNLLTDYVNEGAYAEADALGQRAVAIKRRVLGAEHPSTLLTVNTLAVVYRNEGKYADAEALLRDTLQIRRRVTGEDSPDTLATMNSLANVLSAEQRYVEAEALFDAVIEGKRRLFGDDNPETLASMNSLAEAYRREGKLADAEQLFSKVLTSRRRVLGPTHPSTLAVMLPLARIKLDARQFADAKEISDEAVHGYEQTRSDTWQRYYALSLLATSLAAESKYAEAERMFTSAYDGLVRKRTSIAAENLGMLDEVKGSMVRLHEQRSKPDR
jgi:eukaryotic-like serine/threonine-protein kinase